MVKIRSRVSRLSGLGPHSIRTPPTRNKTHTRTRAHTTTPPRKWNHWKITKYNKYHQPNPKLAHCPHHAPIDSGILIGSTTPAMENPSRFTETFGTRTGRWLANRLYLTGNSSEKLANNVSSFFWNLQAAITVEKVNQWKGKKGNVYANGCMMIHKNIIESDQYNRLPSWVRGDLVRSIQWLKTV